MSGSVPNEAASATQPRFGGPGQWVMLGTSNGLHAVGPYFFHEISNTDQYGTKNKAESVGASLLMAGWL